MESKKKKGVILTEKLVNKLLKRNSGEFTKTLQILVEQDVVMIFFCKDVNNFCLGPLIREVNFKHICVFNPYRGQIISSGEVKYALKKLINPTEEMIFISSNEKDSAFAKKLNMDFVLYTTNLDRHKNRPFPVITDITDIVDITSLVLV